MSNRKTVWVWLVAALFLHRWTTAAAQEGLQIEENVAEVRFPELIDFQLRANSPAEIERIILNYGSDAQSCQSAGSRQTIEFDRSKKIDVNWEWELQRSGSLPPDALVWWEWELTDTSGNTHTTDRLKTRFSDDRQQWRTLSREGVTVHWFRGSADFGEQTLTRTLASLERLHSQMGVPIPEDVHVWVYPSAADVREALAIISEWAGAVAFPRYGTIIIGLEPWETSWAEEVIAHELTHLAVGLAVFNCHGGYLPVWLNEGLAVFAEPEVDEAGVDSVTAALEEGRLPSLRSLSDGFSVYVGGANRAYAQSGEAVRYLVETYGPEQMNQLLAAVAEGITIDKALEQVYGFDTDVLDAAWRQSAGHPATPTRPADEASSRATPTPVPTLSLTGVPGVPTATATTAAAPATATRTPALTRALVDTATPDKPTETPRPTTAAPEAIAALDSPAAESGETPAAIGDARIPGWIWWSTGLMLGALFAIFGLSVYLRSSKEGE